MYFGRSIWQVFSQRSRRTFNIIFALTEKQSKRIAELARFLPFADQKEEMQRLARDLKRAIFYLKFWFELQ